MSDEELEQYKRYAAENVRRGFGKVPFLSAADTVELIDRLTAALDRLLEITADNYERSE